MNFFLDHAPMTALILGAAVSGGDAMGLARWMVESERIGERDATHCGEDVHSDTGGGDDD